jgi:hypothetical protein
VQGITSVSLIRFHGLLQSTGTILLYFIDSVKQLERLQQQSTVTYKELSQHFSQQGVTNSYRCQATLATDMHY